MKYVDHRTASIVEFKTLSNGEVFVSCGEPYLKINPIETANRSFNAIDLIDGDAFTFGSEEPVEKIWHSELVLKN